MEEKKYTSPELEIVSFENSDIITNSEPWGNGDEWNDND